MAMFADIKEQHQIIFPILNSDSFDTPIVLKEKQIMQHNGGLRKRQRRNLVKVSGLSQADSPENEDQDRQIFTTKNDTRIPIFQVDPPRNSAISRYSRVTRDPKFHKTNTFSSTESSDEEITFEDTHINESVNTRPYFLDSTTIARLRQIMILIICSGTAPWYFNSKTHTIEKYSPRLEKLWKILWYLFNLQTFFLTGFQFWSFFSRWSDLENRELFMSSLSVYWYVCVLFANINMHYHGDKMRHYINTLFRFNREFVDKYVIDLDGYQDSGKIVWYISFPSNTSQVFASSALFLVMPYQPWYLFQYIYPKPWYWLIPGALQEFMLVGQVIGNYVLYQWILVAHTNSVKFWLMEMHNQNETGFTRRKIREFQESIECYRKLQILCLCLNESMAPMGILIMKVIIGLGLIPCGYVLIRSMNHKFVEEFPGILTYPIGIIDCAVAGFVALSFAAQMFDFATGFLDSMSRTKKRENRKVLLSCPTLRIWTRRFYFITVTTTITFFRVTADFIINAVIAFPE